MNHAVAPRKRDKWLSTAGTGTLFVSVSCCLTREVYGCWGLASGVIDSLSGLSSPATCCSSVMHQ